MSMCLLGWVDCLNSSPTKPHGRIASVVRVFLPGCFDTINPRPRRSTPPFVRIFPLLGSKGGSKPVADAIRCGASQRNLWGLQCDLRWESAASTWRNLFRGWTPQLRCRLGSESRHQHSRSMRGQSSHRGKSDGTVCAMAQYTSLMCNEQIL